MNDMLTLIYIPVDSKPVSEEIITWFTNQYMHHSAYMSYNYGSIGPIY